MPQPSIAASVAPGQVIADKYLVERVIGEGGMGQGNRIFRVS